MKRKNTGSKAQSDPDSRINKSLRKWNCKCGEDHGSLFEKIACSVKEAKGRCWEGYKPVPGKEAYSEDSCKPVGAKKKKELEKEAAIDPNFLRQLRIAAANGCKKSQTSLSSMGSAGAAARVRNNEKRKIIDLINMGSELPAKSLVQSELGLNLAKPTSYDYEALQKYILPKK